MISKHRSIVSWVLVAPLLAVFSCASVEPFTTAGAIDLADDERRIWNRSIEAAQRLDTSGRLYEDKEFVAYVNGVAAKLLPANLSESGIQLQIRIIRNPFLNAFALSHGAIYLHTGILAKMENEAQLAALIGHELVHVTHRHPLQDFRTVQNASSALAVLGTLSLPGHFGAVVQLVGLLGGLAAVSGYSRSMESEADTTGFEMIVKAGYDPREAPKLFDHLNKEREDRKIKEPFFFGSHPRLSERKANFEALIAKHAGLRGGFDGAERFREKIAPLLIDNSAMDLSLGRWEWAEEAIQRYIKLRPADPEGMYQLGEIRRRRAERDDLRKAEDDFRAALKLDAKFARAYQGRVYRSLSCGSEEDAMMTTPGICLAVCLATMFLSSCATWTIVGGKYEATGDGYEVELPTGWRRFMPYREGLSITRDGMELQSVRIVRLPFDKDPPNTKRKIAMGMLPQEVAEVVIDDLRSNRNIGNVEVVENAPVLVAGHSGFRVVYTYQTGANLRKKAVYYGVLIGQWYYFLSYQAPTRYFFERDLSVFEKIRSSLKITL
jgi:beta-barrel assembly-enhancing protease